MIFEICGHSSAGDVVGRVGGTGLNAERGPGLQWLCVPTKRPQNGVRKFDLLGPRGGGGEGTCRFIESLEVNHAVVTWAVSQARNVIMTLS